MPIRANISFSSGRAFKVGEGEENKRYSDLECALDDCLVKSRSNRVIVSKRWNKSGTDNIDYDIMIVDTPTDEDFEKQFESDAKAMEDMYKEGKELGIYDMAGE